MEPSKESLEEARKIIWIGDYPPPEQITFEYAWLSREIARALEAARRKGWIAGLRDAEGIALTVQHGLMSGYWMASQIQARAAELEKEGR